jgi:hypothetical protein
MNRRVDLVVNGESIAAQQRQPAMDQSGAPGSIGAPVSSDPRPVAPDSTTPNNLGPR